MLCSLFFPLGVWKWVWAERIRSYWKKKEFDVLNCLCYQQWWLYWNCISIIRLYLWYIFNWNIMCTVIGMMNPFQYKCRTLSKCVTIMSKLTDNTCWLESHTTISKKQGSGAEFLQPYATLKLWISGLTLGLAEMQLFYHGPQFPLIFSNSLSHLVVSCQLSVSCQLGYSVVATRPAQMQNQSLLSPVVACVSKVQATWRVFFTRKLFDGPKYGEMKAEKPRLWGQHVKSCCCACGVPAAAEPEHISAFWSCGLWLTSHPEASWSLHDKAEVWKSLYFCQNVLC